MLGTILRLSAKTEPLAYTCYYRVAVYASNDIAICNTSVQACIQQVVRRSFAAATRHWSHLGQHLQVFWVWPGLGMVVCHCLLDCRIPTRSNTHTHTRTQTYIPTIMHTHHACVHIYIYINVCMYVCICMYVCVYTYTHVCMHVHICKYVCVYLCMYVCVPDK